MRISDQAYNRHQVLKTVRSHGPVSRTELSELTGLSGATITEVTANLLERGLICEERSTGGGRGRPRIKISIDPTGGIVIGAVLSPDNDMECSFVNLAGERVHSHLAPFGTPGTLEEFATKIADQIDQAIAESPLERDQITGAAVALPALIDSHTGVVHWLTTFQETSFPFAAHMSDRLNIPVTIENESTCMARAEHWFGRARSMDTFALFHVGLWVSSAQYADGFPRVGANGFNSEIGHTKSQLSNDERFCLCGATGCLATYGSIYGVLLGAKVFEPFNFAHLTDLMAAFHTIALDAENGNAAALDLFTQAGEHLGLAIANHINAFDPGDVLVLNSDERLARLTRGPLERTIEANVFRPMLDRTTIRIEASADDWRWKGAAAHALEQTFLSGLGPKR